MKFRDLDIGDTFDFISPDPTRTSFYLRCAKVSARKYQCAEGYKHEVGTINVGVYHARRMHTREYTVLSHFLSAMVNGDYSGLDDAEERELDEWLADAATPVGHWDTEPVTYFARCNVTGAYGDCTDVRYVWFSELQS